MAERVLVVDDSREIREFLVRYILNPRGFEVVTSSDGLDGLNSALSLKPDLIIMDNQMPRMSGLEVVRELRRRELAIPVILTTAFGSEQTAVEAFRLGVRDYIVKPFDTKEMNAVVERALRESRLERERDELMQELVGTNQQLEQRYRELDMLYSIGKSVTASLDLEEVLQRVVGAVMTVSNAEEGSLMLLDEEQGELYVRASKNQDSEVRSMRLKVNDSLAGHVMETKQAVMMGGDSRWQKIKTFYLVKSLVYMPLLIQDRAIGVLGVYNRVQETMFDQRDMRVLATLADYAAIAIRNAQLFSQSDGERRKASAILSQSDDPVFVLDEHGRLILVNKAARTALRLPEGEVIGRPLEELTENREALDFVTRRVTGRFNSQSEISSADNRIYNASLNLIEGVGRSIVMRDITHLKELDRLKSEFVSVVSHDLRSPLTAILGYVQLMERAGPLTELQQDFIGRVQNSVYNITSLITDLLDLGRLEAGLDLTLALCVPTELLLQLVDEMQPSIEDKRLGLDLELPEETLEVLGDRNRLHQAFSNLLNNAIKYTPTRGRIGIRAVAHNGQLIVQITDTGVGIPPGDQPYIFDKFFRAENVSETHEGTGLGLSIVKSVVERHQGRIWVKSEQGQGTTFTVVLPTVSVEPAHHDEAKTAVATERSLR